MSAADDVRAASARCYAAMNSMAGGGAGPVADAWTEGGAITAQHPIGGRSEGYDTVITSFAKVAGIAGGGEIRLLDQRIDAGSGMAVEAGVETGTFVIAGHQPLALAWRVDGRGGITAWMPRSDSVFETLPMPQALAASPVRRHGAWPAAQRDLRPSVICGPA